jgi:hypothetical protein
VEPTHTKFLLLFSFHLIACTVNKIVIFFITTSKM